MLCVAHPLTDCSVHGCCCCIASLRVVLFTAHTPNSLPKDAESVELLLHSGADASGVLSSSNDEFTTPLHWAAARGNTRLVSMILRGRKSNVNLSNSHGWTPLQLAARRGEVQCVKLLLEAGANVHAKTQAGKTARDLAVANGRSDVVPVLEDYEQRIFEDGERQVKEEGGPP